MLKKLFILFIVMIIPLFLIADYFNSAPENAKGEPFIVHEGESLRMIAARLKSRNLIKSGNFFLASGMIRPGYKYISGKYMVRGGMTSFEILRMISRGKVMTEKVTIPEGYNIYEVAVKLDDSGITSKNEFLKYCTDTRFLKSIGIKSATAEGYLFPDTYLFKENMNAGEVIKIMNKRFSSVIESIGVKNSGENGLSFEDTIKLASLIEEEAAVASERKYISSVFHNRIKMNMKLDCDPTVRYAVKKFAGRIYIADLKTDSPYNTYIYRGLPPTPISSPGRESIIAAIRPAETAYLYFVSRNDGSHYFSKTLREHNSAVKKFRDHENNRFIDQQRLD